MADGYETVLGLHRMVDMAYNGQLDEKGQKFLDNTMEHVKTMLSAKSGCFGCSEDVALGLFKKYLGMKQHKEAASKIRSSEETLPRKFEADSLVGEIQAYLKGVSDARGKTLDELGWSRGIEGRAYERGGKVYKMKSTREN